MSTQKKPELVQAIHQELAIRANFFGQNRPIETLYFGGGTPSLLSQKELGSIIEQVRKEFKCKHDMEICLEGNPDDLSLDYLRQLKSLNINRLSIGIQSLDDDLLNWMNRSHTSVQAEQVIADADMVGFEQLSVDLIYGIPGLSMDRWQKDLDKVLNMPVHHLSAYSLTLEDRTAYMNMVKKGRAIAPSDEQASQHYDHLIQAIQKAGWEQYEVSNFCKDDLYSRHNTAYWTRKPYLGIGPSAHSYDGHHRYWNVASNTAYLQSLQKGELALDSEELTIADKINEYLLTGLRTKWGVDSETLKLEFEHEWNQEQVHLIQYYLEKGWLYEEQGRYWLNSEGMLMADHISASLFVDHSSQMSS